MSIETEEVRIERVERENVGERDERVVVHVDAGWTFAGMLERNFFRDRVNGPDGKKRTLSHLIQPGVRLRFWGGLGRPVHQVEVWSQSGVWQTVWDTTNDFRTLAEDDAAWSEYAAFIEREGDRIATLIDSGEEPDSVERSLDKEHSGNTAAWAWKLGTDRAKDQERAETFRAYWNHKWDPDREHKPGSLVNPAVLTIGADA